jgi:aspartyl-tRNA(Asn)/glutamyl-tRNA(Gln) amidotransferase subunit C
MAQQLSRDEVARIAALANIELSADDITMFARQLTDIVEYAASIQKADTSDVAADSGTATGANLPPPRADVPLPSLDRAEALATAPDARPDAGLFRVPKVL